MRKFRGVVDFDLLISLISWLLRLMKPKCTMCFGLCLLTKMCPKRCEPSYACTGRHVCFFEPNGNEMTSLQSFLFLDQTIQTGSKSELINHQITSMDTLASAGIPNNSITYCISSWWCGFTSMLLELVTPRSSLVWRQPLERKLRHLSRRRQHRDPTLSNS